MAGTTSSTARTSSELLAQLDAELFAIQEALAEAIAAAGPLKSLRLHVRQPVACNTCHFLARGVPRLIAEVQSRSDNAAECIRLIEAKRTRRRSR